MEVASVGVQGRGGLVTGEFKSRAVSLGQGSCSDHPTAQTFRPRPVRAGQGCWAPVWTGGVCGGHPEPVLGAGVSVLRAP